MGHLNSTGDWQSTQAYAITASDSSVVGGSSGSLVGVNRPAHAVSSIALDDFTVLPAVGDPTPPNNVTITPPTGTLAGVISVTATASDNVAVSRVEFYAAGSLMTTLYQPTSAPSTYQFSFDTHTGFDGAHTLTVKAYDGEGNVSQASASITTQNGSSARPDLPQHSQHINVAEEALSGWADAVPGTTLLDDEANNLLTNNVDEVTGNPAALSAIYNVAPATPQLLYTNVSNIYLNLLTDWTAYADVTTGVHREDAFFHVSQALTVGVEKNGGSSVPDNEFWAALSQQNYAFSSVSGSSSGFLNPTTAVPFVASNGSIYLGYPEHFRDITLNVTVPASGGWTYVLEYPTAVDANGVPTSWASITPTHDNTNGLTTSGTISFDPQPNWVAASINGSYQLSYVRFRATSTHGTAPTAQISADDYLNTNSNGTQVTVPAYDYAEDPNNVGYLTDSEYAIAQAHGYNARFAYQGRVLTYYGPWRFVTDPGRTDFQTWAAQFNQKVLRGNPLAAGLTPDNSNGNDANTYVPTTVIAAESTDQTNFNANLGTALGSVYQKIAPAWLLPNTSGYDAAKPVVQATGTAFEEKAYRALDKNWSIFDGNAAHVNSAQGYTTPPPDEVMSFYLDHLQDSDPAAQIPTLAYYYLLANRPTTLVNFFGSTPSDTWSNHWTPAAAVNVGQPTEAFDPTNPTNVFAQLTEVENGKSLTYYVFQRTYQNALVLYKPLGYTQGVGSGNYGNGSTTFTLTGGPWYMLNADGTISQTAVTSPITLDDGQGMILMTSKSPPPGSAPPAQPAVLASPSVMPTTAAEPAVLAAQPQQPQPLTVMAPVASLGLSAREAAMDLIVAALVADGPPLGGMQGTQYPLPRSAAVGNAVGPGAGSDSSPPIEGPLVAGALVNSGAGTAERVDQWFAGGLSMDSPAVRPASDNDDGAVLADALTPPLG